VRAHGLAGRALTGYASAGAHICVARAFDMAGLGTAALRLIPCDAAHRIRLDALAECVAAARARGTLPVIPYRSNIGNQPKFFAKRLYKLHKLRARIEQMIGKAKRFKRLAMRCEKTAVNYVSIAAIVCVFILIKSVHTG